VTEPTSDLIDEQTCAFVATVEQMRDYLSRPRWRETVRAGQELNDRLCLLAAARAHRLADDPAIVEAGDAARSAESKAVVHVADLLHQLGTVLGPGERDPLTGYDTAFATIRRALPLEQVTTE
jgi:hypothetical protein